MEDLKEEIRKLSSIIKFIESLPQYQRSLSSTLKPDTPIQPDITTKHKFYIPRKFAFTLQEIASIVKLKPSTLSNNTKRMPGDSLYLRAFMISSSGRLVKNKDLAEFINWVYKTEVEVPTFLFPANFELTTKQMAHLLNCSEETVRVIKGKKGMTFRELEEFISQNYIMEPIVRPRKK